MSCSVQPIAERLSSWFQFTVTQRKARKSQQLEKLKTRWCWENVVWKVTRTDKRAKNVLSPLCWLAGGLTVSAASGSYNKTCVGTCKHFELVPTQRGAGRAARGKFESPDSCHNHKRSSCTQDRANTWMSWWPKWLCLHNNSTKKHKLTQHHHECTKAAWHET